MSDVYFKNNLGAPFLKYWQNRKKKQENWVKIKQNMCFWIFTQMLVEGFIPRKSCFQRWKHVYKYKKVQNGCTFVKFCNLYPSTSIWVQTQKADFFILWQFSSFYILFTIFMIKHEKAYSNQHLNCAAPKRWSKYTTFTNMLIICLYYK